MPIASSTEPNTGISWSAPTRFSTRPTVFCGRASTSFPPWPFIRTRMSSSTCTPVESMNSSPARSTTSSAIPLAASASRAPRNWS